MKLGIQLWSVRNEANEDFRGTVKELKKYGYTGAEIAGITSLSYSEMKKILEDEGMDIISAHISLSDIDNDELMCELKNTGMKYVVFNGLDTNPEVIENTCENLKNYCEKCKKYGLKLLYHNHGYEFFNYKGKLAIDYVYDDVGFENLGAEIDTCWVQISGTDTPKFLLKHKEHNPLIHIKDYKGVHGEDSFTYTALGMGLLKTDAILDAVYEVNPDWLIVEQDKAENGFTPMESAKLSADYIIGKMKCR